MKTHLIGSSGYIANRILQRIDPSTVLKYAPTQRNDEIHLDLTQISGFDFSVFSKNDYVVFLSAISSPDLCERQYDYAYSVNVTGTIRFIENLIERGANILFFSSDVVNGATALAHDENVPAKPFGRYAQMKHAVERHFCKSEKVKVFRLSYVFSYADKFMNYILDCDKKKETANVFDALYRNVIYIEDIIDAIFALKDTFLSWNNNTFNLSGDELLSRKDLAEIYKVGISTSFMYNTTVPDDKFFKARPNIIETKSLYLEKLLNRGTTSIRKAMKLEFGKDMS
jgi:dTDP-4-dehydrorhamnose reductase